MAKIKKEVTLYIVEFEATDKEGKDFTYEQMFVRTNLGDIQLVPKDNADKKLLKASGVLTPSEASQTRF